MPADRFLHPRLGHSDKVNLLTDLEFRVWVQYILSADDFGVMRQSAHTLQAANDHLANRPRKQIERCLAACLDRGLLLAFDHQGRQYVCQWDWQAFQKVEYPRPTFEPKPPAEVLARCDALTQGLFQKHPGGVTKRKPKESQSVPENLGTSSQISPELSETSSQRDPDYAGGQARETAKATAKANGSHPGSEEKIATDAARFLERYQALYLEHRNGAKLFIKPNLDWVRVCDLLGTWDFARLEQLAAILLTTDDEWVKKTDRSIGVFASRASWCDDRLKAWELENGVGV